MSGLFATAKPYRIKATHRRRRKVAWGQSVQRYYDPTIGRFLSVDPVTADGNTGGNFNRYWYANNNPYRFTDPDGRLGLPHPGDSGAAFLTEGGISGVDVRRADALNTMPQRTQAQQTGNVSIGKMSIVYPTAEEAKAAGESKAIADNDGEFFAPSYLTLVSPLESANGFVYQNYILNTGMPPMVGLGGAAPSAGMLARAVRMLEQGGVKSVTKAMRSAGIRIVEHKALIETYRKAGGYTTSMEREVRAWEREIEAYKSVLGGD